MYAYAATAQGDFGTLDLTTGAYMSIGPSGVTSIVGMGFIGGTLYGVDNNSSGAGFYSIDTSSGAATMISTLMQSSGAPVTAYGGTTVGGDFFGATQDASTSLFLTPPAGNPTAVGSPLGFPADGLVALGPGAGPGNLYVSEFTGNTVTGDELHTITVGGMLSDIGGLNDGMGNGQQSLTGLIFGNTLYSIDGNSIYTYTVSPTSVSALLTTTAITGLGPNGDQVFAVAAAPSAVTPEPSSMIIVSIAFGTVGLVHARRRFLST